MGSAELVREVSRKQQAWWNATPAPALANATNTQKEPAALLCLQPEDCKRLWGAEEYFRLEPGDERSCSPACLTGNCAAPADPRAQRRSFGYVPAVKQGFAQSAPLTLLRTALHSHAGLCFFTEWVSVHLLTIVSWCV